jgi:hypothetical protein
MNDREFFQLALITESIVTDMEACVWMLEKPLVKDYINLFQIL